MLEPVLSADSFVDNTLNDTICQWFQCWNQYLDRSSWLFELLDTIENLNSIMMAIADNYAF